MDIISQISCGQSSNKHRPTTWMKGTMCYCSVSYPVETGSRPTGNYPSTLDVHCTVVTSVANRHLWACRPIIIIIIIIIVYYGKRQHRTLKHNIKHTTGTTHTSANARLTSVAISVPLSVVGRWRNDVIWRCLLVHAVHCSVAQRSQLILLSVSPNSDESEKKSLYPDSDPDRRQNLIICALGHCQPSLKNSR